MARRAMQPGDFTKNIRPTAMKQVYVNGKTELRKREKGEKARIHCYMAQGSACTPAGKMVRRKVYGDTVREASERLYTLLEHLATFTPGKNPTTDLTPSSTLLEGFNKYYDYAKTTRGLKANTLVGYDSSFKALPKSCREVSLETFTPGMLEELLGAPLTYTQAINSKKVLRGIFSYCVRNNVLPFNPMHGVEVHRRLGEKRAEDARAFTPEELEAIYAATSSPQLELLCRFLASMGLRKSEALALYWEKGSDRDYIDLSTGELHTGTYTVSKAAPEGGAFRGEWKIEPHGSSKLGTRVLTVPEGLLQRLKDYRAEHPEDVYVFPSPRYREKVWNPNAANNELRTIFDTAEISWRCTSHNFRDTSAGRLVAAGYPPNVVADWLGHSNPAITLQRYYPRNSVPMSELAKTLNKLL